MPGRPLPPLQPSFFTAWASTATRFPSKLQPLQVLRDSDLLTTYYREYAGTARFQRTASALRGAWQRGDNGDYWREHPPKNGPPFTT